MLDLQHVLGLVLDGVRDGVAVRRPEDEGSQDEQIERALQQLSLHRRVGALRHVTPEDNLPEWVV